VDQFVGWAKVPKNRYTIYPPPPLLPLSPLLQTPTGRGVSTSLYPPWCFNPRRKGYITVDQFLEWAKVPKNRYTVRIFDMLGSLEHDKYLDFGEWLKGISTYCMMG
jgi:hypothetical protein